MSNLKKSLIVFTVLCLTLTTFSFKSVDSNEENLNVATVAFQSSQLETNNYEQAARITAVVKVAKKVWDRSGKEAAKFVAYEVVLRGIDWLLSTQDPVQKVALADEMNYKLSKL